MGHSCKKVHVASSVDVCCCSTWSFKSCLQSHISREPVAAQVFILELQELHLHPFFGPAKIESGGVRMLVILVTSARRNMSCSGLIQNTSVCLNLCIEFTSMRKSIRAVDILSLSFVHICHYPLSPDHQAAVLRIKGGANVVEDLCNCPNLQGQSFK